MKLAIKIKRRTRILKSPRIISGGGLERTSGRQVLNSSSNKEEGSVGLWLTPTRRR